MLHFFNYDLMQHNTFGISAKCKEYIQYDTIEELRSIIPTLVQPYLHIGSGSNLLFVGDYPGTIIHSNLKGINIQPSSSDDYVLACFNGSEIFDDIVEYCTGHNYYGLENLSLIPGEMGAAAVQNIGAYGVEIKDYIEYIDAISLIDGKSRRFSKEECQYGYRSSIFKNRLKGQYAIVSVTLRLSTVFTPHLNYGNLCQALNDAANITAKQVRNTIIAIRQEKLPSPQEIGSAGSFFMNPIVMEDKFQELLKQYPSIPSYPTDNGIKIPAGWLIDQCGWKGKRIGDAGVYPKQALVLVNYGKAKGKEILDLCKKIQDDVIDKFGIQITPEVNIIG